METTPGEDADARAATVSVALCTYDGERWLGPFLDSLARQTRLPDELVVSDDGSSDATLATVTAFARTAPFPVHVAVTPRRLGSTFNFAAAFARCAGTLIAPADQDDVWGPTKLERLVASMEARGLAMAFSDGMVIDDEGRPVDSTLWAGVGFTPAQRRRFARDPVGLLLRRSVVTGAAMMFRAEHLDRLLPFPPALNGPGSLMLQDRWIALVLASVAEVGAVAEPLIAFRQHAAQQTGLRQPVTTGEAGRQLRRSTGSVALGLVTRAEQLEAVRERVRGDAHPGVEARLTAAIGHLRARAALPPARVARLPRVAREWSSGRYRRYSGGTRSAVVDLGRPAADPHEASSSTMSPT